MSNPLFYPEYNTTYCLGAAPAMLGLTPIRHVLQKSDVDTMFDCLEIESPPKPFLSFHLAFKKLSIIEKMS